MRFTTASVALFAGAAMAMPSFPVAEPTTVYSTKAVTVTSCPPNVYSCPGHGPKTTDAASYPVSEPSTHPTGKPSAHPTSHGDYPTEYQPTIDCPSESTYPVEKAPYPTGKPKPTAHPTGTEVYPTTHSTTTVVVTYTTCTSVNCVPTVTSSTTLIYPTVHPTDRPTNYPTGIASPTGSYPVSPTPIHFEGVAASFGTSFAVASLAVIAAIFLA
ncbi:hypothetical protein ACO22_02129 [Paracoccidioides brasiliensis]|uniref:GPI anchored serine-rich protein n=1 Tax=Paracoccidioides brasiliensis TaxID=121759 RepID=A0A1D2JJL5_PARBR|nr:hypothetical protein ACO22_02129 [Paracoccidioides brasiliensis]